MARRDFSSWFGIILKRYRLGKGLSQEEVAERAGIHRTHLSLIERGKRKPHLNAAWDLADAVGVRFEDLSTEAGRAFRRAK